MTPVKFARCLVRLRWPAIQRAPPRWCAGTCPRNRFRRTHSMPRDWWWFPAGRVAESCRRRCCDCDYAQRCHTPTETAHCARFPTAPRPPPGVQRPPRGRCCCAAPRRPVHSICCRHKLPTSARHRLPQLLRLRVRPATPAAVPVMAVCSQGRRRSRRGRLRLQY